MTGSWPSLAGDSCQCVGRQPELKSVALSRVRIVPHAPQENAYGHQKAKLAWKSRIFLGDFQGHTSIRSPEGKGARVFLLQTEQQTSLFQLGLENCKQCSVPIGAGWANTLRIGRDPCLILPSLLQRDSSPHVLLCYPWQASTFTKKKKKKIGSKWETKEEKITFLPRDGDILY